MWLSLRLTLPLSGGDSLPSTEKPMSRETATEQIVRILSEEIVNGRLRPGTALDEHGLARRFQVSRTPVREALGLLATRGLAEKRPHRGTIVISVAPEKVMEMFEVMAELEGCCARFAAERMTHHECEALRAIHAEGAAVASHLHAEAYARVNVRFHRAIYTGAHNEELIALTEHMRQRLSPFRRAQFHIEGRPAQSHREHALVLEAILAGQAEKAQAAMRTHMLAVKAAYASYTPPTAELA